MGDLISSRMLDLLPKFFPSTCTIQSNTPTADAHNQPIASWANLTGYVEIACRCAPLTATERRQFENVVEEATHMVALKGAYTAITVEMRAVVDDVTYDITGVRTDSQGKVTYLAAKIVGM